MTEGMSTSEVAVIWQAWAGLDHTPWADAVDTRINGGTPAQSWNDIILLAADAIKDEPYAPGEL
jgi:hypothetical protein